VDTAYGDYVLKVTEPRFYWFKQTNKRNRMHVYVDVTTNIAIRTFTFVGYTVKINICNTFNIYILYRQKIIHKKFYVFLV
jgi:hypothetical protein